VTRGPFEKLEKQSIARCDRYWSQTGAAPMDHHIKIGLNLTGDPNYLFNKRSVD
jgi:hypothetical protein